jgi:hypothetical protein
MAADLAALSAVVRPVDQGELHLLADHAGVGNAKRDQHCSMGFCRLLSRLFQEVFYALRKTLVNLNNMR